MKNMFLKLFAWSSFLTLLLGGLLLVLPSCMDEKDFKFDKISGVEWTGSYALPLINSSMTIKDLIGEKDSGQIKEESDGLIYLEYKEQVLSNKIGDDLKAKLTPTPLDQTYSLPAIKFPLNKSFPVPAAQVSNINLPANDSIVSITFSPGSIFNIKVKNNGSGVSANITALNLQIVNTIGGDLIGSFSGSINAGQTSLDQGTSLSGKTIKNQLTVKITLITSATLPANITIYTSTSSGSAASAGEILLKENLVIDQSQTISFPVDPFKLSEVLFKAGSLDYVVDSKIQYPVDVSIGFDKLTKNSIVFSEQIPIVAAAMNASSIKDGSAAIVDYKADFTPTANQFPISIKAIGKTSSQMFKWGPNNNSVKIKVEWKNIDFKHVKGFFGEQLIQLDESSFDISAFDNSLKGINVSLVNPQISFNISNGYGVPINLNFKKLIASNEGQSKTIKIKSVADGGTGNPFDLLYPVNFGDKAKTTKVEIDGASVNEVYNLNPNKVSYQIEGRLNTNLVSGNNFMTDTSKVTVNMYAKIPLYGKASGLALNDTVDNGLKDDIEDIDVEFIKLKAVIKNQFPIDAQVQIYLANDNYQIQDSLFTPAQTAIVTSSTVDGNGELVKEGVYDQIIEVNKAKFEKLIESPYLIIKAKMATAEAGQKDVKIKSTYKLDVKLGVQTKLNIKVKVQ